MSRATLIRLALAMGLTFGIAASAAATAMLTRGHAAEGASEAAGTITDPVPL